MADTLITGATGHIGFRTLVIALGLGYKVRAAVRSDAKADILRNHPDIKALNLPADALTFVLVPEITADGAYNEAIKGVKHVIHIASPLASNLDPKEVMAHPHELVIHPAVSGTLSILEAAAGEKSVQRVVITASIAAIMPFGKSFAQAYPPLHYDSTARVPDYESGMTYLNSFHVYVASKTAAFNATERWVAENKDIGFDVVNIIPSFVTGPNHLERDPVKAMTGSNRAVACVFTGKTAPNVMPGLTVHLDDVAGVHVWSLDTEYVPSAPGTCREYITSQPAVFENVKGIVAKHFPEAVESGVVPNDGTQPTVVIDLDVSVTEKTFGFKHKVFEEQVKDLAAYYIELSTKPETNGSL